jgi:hypothetical protein
LFFEVQDNTTVMQDRSLSTTFLDTLTLLLFLRR